MPFEFENTTLPRSLLVVPAEKLTGDGTPAAIDAVIDDSLSPNDTPLALLNSPEISVAEILSVTR
jgi:hypothetical protein